MNIRVEGGTLVGQETHEPNPIADCLRASVERAWSDIEGKDLKSGGHEALRQLCQEVCEQHEECLTWGWWRDTQRHNREAGFACAKRTIAADAKRYLEWMREELGG